MSDRLDWLRLEIRAAARRGDAVTVNKLYRECTAAASMVQRQTDIISPPLLIRSLPATVKAIGAPAKRELEGWASTAERDHIGDVVEPLGCTWRGEPPLLWHHDHRSPVGRCIEVRPSAKGVWIRAKIAQIDEPGTLRDRCDEAWQAVKSGLVRSLSVGFRPLEHAPLGDGKGIRFRKWWLHECSLVSIAANQAASIERVS